MVATAFSSPPAIGIRHVGDARTTGRFRRSSVRSRLTDVVCSAKQQTRSAAAQTCTDFAASRPTNHADRFLPVYASCALLRSLLFYQEPRFISAYQQQSFRQHRDVSKSTPLTMDWAARAGRRFHPHYRRVVAFLRQNQTFNGGTMFTRHRFYYPLRHSPQNDPYTVSISCPDMPPAIPATILCLTG